jgi:predicted phage terminase large subunit-like protein
MADGGSRLTQAEAARELLRRRRARAALEDYAQSIVIPGAPISDDPDEWLFKPIETCVAKHHIVTMRAIEECVRADFGRLMIFQPPGSAKSTYASVVGTTWAMGAFPGLRVLMSSYAATPIIRHSKRARQIAQSAAYAAIWPGEEPTTLVHGSKAADEWALTNGSELYAAGLLGSITSTRADLVIIDDPVAGREEAESETIRAKTLQAYEDDILTRLKPKASVILIQTRWHQMDLAGSILPEHYDGRSGPVLCRDGQWWNVLNIAAKCERNDDPIGRQIGEYLWPEWFTPKHWAIYEAKPRTWASLYQQRPAPPDGILFKRDDFQRYELGKQPGNLRMYMASDFAVKDRKAAVDPDFTEHGACGIDTHSDLWITDWFSGQVDTSVSIDAGLDMAKTTKPTLWFGESGVIESAIEPAITARMRQRKVYAARHLLPSIADKVARARGFSARVAAKTVHIPNCEWGDALIDQLCAFPAGRYDDKVDVCSLLGRGADMLFDAREPEKTETKPFVPFTRAHFERLDKQSKTEQRDRKRHYS